MRSMTATAAAMLFAVAGPGFATAAELGDADITFDAFCARHGKTYQKGSAEIAARRRRFESTVASVRAQNARYAAGESTWWAAVNEYADWDDVELARKRIKPVHDPTRLSASSLDNTPPASSNSNNKNPASVSWMPYQTPVKNQGACGSCWAFATTEVLESHLAIAENNTDSPLVLAPQTLVDCLENPNHCGGTGGCEGAIAELGFNFTRDKGMATEADLPYKARDQACPAYKEAVTCSGYVKNEQNSADALETALALHGPQAVTVAANWQTYGGGIFSDGCTNEFPGSSCTLDHAVVAVGYTAEYWLVRNSWGAGWGEDGYIRLTRKYDATTFTDNEPENGDACKPFPAKQYPMGESGILFDTAYPTDVRRSN